MKLNQILVILLFLLALATSAQDLPTLFKASSFSEAYFNPVYQELKQRKASNQFISEKEQQWLDVYQNYIDNYFNLLNNNQQDLFHQQRAKLEYNKLQNYQDTNVEIEQKALAESLERKSETDSELLLGHILFSGVSGVFYGIQMNFILDVKSTSARVGLPLLISGGSLLVPIFSPLYKDINMNSLWLRVHGKTMGGIYGYFLSSALFGDDIFETYDFNSSMDGIQRNKKPIALSMSLLSSVALGHVGLYLGKTKPWTDGRIATYQYYSYFLPAIASGIYLSFEDGEHIQPYGIIVAAGVPLGYLAAQQVANKINYTRGDMHAVLNNTILGGLFGGSILAYGDFESTKALLWPIGGAIAGSFVGHMTYRNFHITRPEGRRLSYAALGGGLIGLGATLIADANEAGTYVLIPSLFAAGGYGLLLNYYYKQPRFASRENSSNNFDFAFHPESFLINKHLPAYAKAPLFSMRIML